MEIKNIFLFVLAVSMSLIAAHHRFYDSSHSMGLINNKGGKVLHPLVLEKGRNFYSVIVTATVLPPYRGNARIALEGNPHMNYSLYNSGPIIDLGVHRHPVFDNNIFYGLQPRDSLALWMVMKPDKEGFLSLPGEKTTTDISYDQDCCASSEPVPASRLMDQSGEEKLAISLYDTVTNQPVLRIPVIFNANGAESHASENQ